MNPSEIKRLRTQSVLKELLPEALSTLEDELLRGLCDIDSINRPAVFIRDLDIVELHAALRDQIFKILHFCLDPLRFFQTNRPYDFGIRACRRI